MSKSYLLKIYKPGTKIYRIAQVPGQVTLERLHQAIHEWLEFPTFEMYAFFPNNKLLSESGWYAPQMMKKHSANAVRLEDLGLKKDQRILYVYDMTALLQFYIHVEAVEDRDCKEIRLLRRNGHLKLDGMPEEREPLVDHPNAWRVYEGDLAMLDCMCENDALELLDTAHAMNLDIRMPGTKEELAEQILNCMVRDETLVLRMMPIHLMQALEQIWKTPEGEQVMMPYEFLVRLSLLGFLQIEENEQEQTIVVSEFARDWYSSVLQKNENLRLIEMYARWHAATRGILASYGVVQMDDLFALLKRYFDANPEVDEFCDFMMQRMEWNGECCALEDEDDLYWSVPDPDKAAQILEKRKQYDLTYKNLSLREILDNAESGGWQNIDCGQELFEALQGMALEADEVRDLLNEIIHAFSKGLEPYEIMAISIPPINQIGRAAHAKVRLMLRKVRRQLPDFGLMGYSIEEYEHMNPGFRSEEGITVIKGGK